MRKNQRPFFSIVIPTYERPKDLKVCLESLSVKIQNDAPSYEIIVSDDSISGSSKEMVQREFTHVKWFEGKKCGPAGNRNRGATKANGEWIVFIDDDCIPQKKFLAQYNAAIINNPSILIFEGSIIPERPKNTWAEGCPENTNGGMLWTSNLCVKKSVFNDLDGFDEKFRVAYEDVDFAYRIKQARIKSLFVPTAVVCHPWRSLKKGGKNWKNSGYELESLELFLCKHGINEVVNLKLYARYLLRTLTADQLKSVLNYRFRGYTYLLGQIITIIFSLLIIMKFQWREFKKRN